LYGDETAPSREEPFQETKLHFEAGIATKPKYRQQLKSGVARRSGKGKAAQRKRPFKLEEGARRTGVRENNTLSDRAGPYMTASPCAHYALRPAHTCEGVAPHSLLARRFCRTAGAVCFCRRLIPVVVPANINPLPAVIGGHLSPAGVIRGVVVNGTPKAEREEVAIVKPVCCAWAASGQAAAEPE